MKKIGMLLIAFVVMLFMTFATVQATEEQEVLPSLTGVCLSPEGVLTFDEIEGADAYWFGLNYQAWTFTSGQSIISPLHTLCDDNSTYMSPYCRVEDPGTYLLELTATSGGADVSETYYGMLHFDGTKFSLEPVEGARRVIVFDSNGGSGRDPMFVPVNEPIERPQPPEKEGTTFLGWYKDAEFKEKFDFGATNDFYMVLYAKWGEPTLIQEVAFDGIVVPVAGTHPEEELFRTITTTTEGLRIINAEWRDESNGNKRMTSSDTFDADKHYLLSIAIDFEDGYMFPERDPFWIEDHMTLNVEPNMTDFRDNEFIISYTSVAATSTDPTPTDPTPTDPTPTDPTPTDPEPVVVAAPNLDGFTVSAGAGKVKLSWNKVDDAKGYYVYQGTSKKKLTKVATINKNTTLTYTKKKLKDNTTYYYKVVAYKVVKKKNKNIVTSKVLSAKTAPAKPTLTIAARNSESLKLTVKAVKGATKYEIYRSAKKDGEYFIEGELTKAGKFTNVGVDLNKTYYYKVRACNKSACSGWSKIVSKKVTMSAPTVKAKSTAKKEVTLTFTGDDSSEVGYLYRSTKKNGKYKLVATITAASYVDTTKSKKTYYYKARTAATVNGKLVYSPYSKVTKVKSK